ncbi:hypothetical protein M422DRAFT_67759 [Sphaerobolus stellatus SS14]|uniref:MIT domain-containing protein n=1 Tax=Sphaerobolus stellatus (strain SS14) TaxID=990650 RepID=A0A0C9VAY8_SPHS4|nr:hypothetical protein M422DRAFT_67759 [Sphaerobolus stellatus SS14]
MPDTPLNKAHQHASNAEDYLTRGLLIPAAEEHYKSAEAFLQCIEQANDEGIKRTLRMLYNEHNKAGKELQRKIGKLREEGKDPSLPQPPTPPLSREHRTHGISSSNQSVLSRHGSMQDSNYPIDESYMMLGQQQPEPQDTFNQFWNILEGMLDNLSQPVAFATAPLGRADSTSDIQRKQKEHPSNLQGESQLQKSISRFRLDHESDFSDLEEIGIEDGESPSEDSFFMVPSSTSSLNTRLKKENESLKAQLLALQQKLQTSERMRTEQEEQLRERIELARREAQRVKSSGFLPPRTALPVDLGSLTMNIPGGPMLSQVQGPREAQLNRRLKELEDEVKAVRLENEKQKQMITKFRERWEKLKESAKKKKLAKTNQGSENDVRDQRIDEEPEAEAAAAAELQAMSR